MTRTPLLSRADHAIAEAIAQRDALAGRLDICERLTFRSARLERTMREWRGVRSAQREFWVARSGLAGLALPASAGVTAGARRVDATRR